MQSQYQQILNKSQTGALGPKTSAYWKNLQKSDGPIYSMGATPLVFSPISRNYVTAFTTPQEAQASISFTSAFGSKPEKYDDLDFGYGFGRSRSTRKSRKRKSRKRKSRKRKSRKRKSRKSRKSRKKWNPPRSVKKRRKMLKRCGEKCFLIPDPQHPKFPICTHSCQISQDGLRAAYSRAKQWGYNDIATKAKKLLKN